MKRLSILAALWLASVLCPSPVLSFCGFYVASGDARLFNHASRVVLVRDEDRTVLTMANDFKGEPQEFAIVVPVPTVLEKGQIHVGDPALVDHLDAYSAPRLVEYFDPDPCPRAALEGELAVDRLVEVRADRKLASASMPLNQGVRIEARYTVGEYDILILSATESRGLERWLIANGYRVPAGAARVLGSYIRQDLKFFVAKVNLRERQKLGFSYLRPIQVAYESPRFMLPIRLGMVNADGPQELYVYALTRRGRVETTNYRTVKLPSDVDVPVFVKDKFSDFYRAMFGEQVRKAGMTTVFTEYAWDMSWCDPCASPPLTSDELTQLGVFWAATPQASSPGLRPGAPSSGVFITRLHLRYDGPHFPEDLVFQETADRENFQGRYILRHEWTGDGDCEQAKAYRAGLADRRYKEATNLAGLTGWSLATIRGQMAVDADWSRPADRTKWWQRMWKN